VGQFSVKLIMPGGSVLGGNQHLLVMTALGVLVLAIDPAGAGPIADFVDPTDTTITFGSTPTPCPAEFTCES